MKIRPVEDKLFRADCQKDRQTDRQTGRLNQSKDRFWQSIFEEVKKKIAFF